MQMSPGWPPFSYLWRRQHICKALILPLTSEQAQAGVQPYVSRTLGVRTQEGEPATAVTVLQPTWQEGRKGAASTTELHPPGWLPGLHHPLTCPAFPHFLGATGKHSSSVSAEPEYIEGAWWITTFSLQCAKNALPGPHYRQTEKHRENHSGALGPPLWQEDRWK